MEEALVSDQWQEEQIIERAWCEAIESWRWLLQRATLSTLDAGLVLEREAVCVSNMIEVLTV